MTRPTRHIIERQVLNISTSNLEQAQRLEKQAGILINEIVLPTLERCFDSAAPAGQHLTIERLEVDLGVLQENRLKEDLEERLDKAVREALQHRLNQAGRSPESSYPDGPAFPSPPGTFDGQGPQQPWDNTGTDDKTESERLRATPAANFEALLHFLKKGRLPWWKQATPAALEDDWPESLSPAQQKALTNLLSEAPDTRTRLAGQFNPVFLSRLLGQLGAPADWLDSWQWLSDHGLESHADARPVLQQHFWIACIAEALDRSRKPRLTGVFLRLWETSSAPYDAVWRAILQRLAGEPDGWAGNMPASLKNALKVGLKRAGKGPNSADDQPIHKPAENAAPGLPKNGASKPESPAGKAAETANPQTPASIPKNPASRDDDAVFVDDAGLVLLHPFFPALFESCALVKDKRFVSPEAGMRAVRLLGWLVWSTEEVPEYQLLLPKLLCGIAWEAPMPAASPLSEHEIQEAGQLLQATIQHWPAIGNTSPDGLREGFLRRQGKLTPLDRGAWRLEVERKGQDVLLSRLPWGYSILRWPWMSGLLHVSWM